MKSSPLLLLSLLLIAVWTPAGEAQDVKDSEAFFEDVTKSLGLDGLRGQYFHWCDFDGDGRPDLLVNGKRPFRNTGPPDFAFTDARESTGLAKVKGRGIFVDIDNDGDFDLATTQGQIWRNDGEGHFSLAGDIEGFAAPERCTGMSWFDMDGDGWLDVYFTVGEDWNKGKPKFFGHRLLLNVEGRAFTDATDLSSMAAVGRYGRAASACDHDLDGDMDLYVGNYRLQANFFLRNDGNARFSDVAKKNGSAGREMRYRDPKTGRVYGPYRGHTIGAAWADFNNDGLFDLFVANLVHKFAGAHPRMGRDIRGHICDDSKVYLNLGGPDFGFSDVRVSWGIPLRPVGGKGVFKGDELWCNVVCGDFDNDGYVDAYVPQIYDLSYAKAKLFRNREGKGFLDVGKAAGVGVINTYGGAWADFNGDGRLDLVTGGQDGANPRGSKEKKFKGRVHLFRNRCPGRNWIGFDLRAASGNRLAVGAQVFLKAGGLGQVRQVEIGTGSHGQQNDGRLHFGLGESTSITSVFIRWGRGLAQILSFRPKPGQTHVITEPTRPAFRIKGMTHRGAGPLAAEVEVEVAGPGRRAYVWDTNGDSRFDVMTREPTLLVEFDSVGRHLVRVLVLTRKSAVGFEASCIVDTH
jgi:hypothetical protein